jgi:Tol biopolymer transport system component
VSSRRLHLVVLLAVVVLVAVVLASVALPAGATVPGPNGLIVFRAGEPNGQIYTIGPDGTRQEQLTNLPGDTFLPHWSPQSSRIVFEFDPANPVNNDFCNIAMMNRNGGALKIFPLANGDACEASPTFSADGHRIYYEGFDGVSRDAIFSMALNGNDRRLVSDCQGTGVTDPEVSPDGTMISFTCFNANGDTGLFDANIDGSALRQLTPYSAEVGNKADWSPDSKRIMFITAVNEGTPDAQVNTWTIAPDGSDLDAVTDYPAGGTLAFGNSYSPDGNWILLRIEQNGLYALEKIHPDGTDLTDITPFSSFRPRNMAWGRALAATFPQDN